MSRNENLRHAKKAKNDEFYTRYEDIEKEVSNYKEELKGKWVYCNCDDEWSNFWKYFKDHYSELGLMHLTATGIGGKRLDYDGFEVVEMDCIADCEGILGYDKGDFRSLYCIDILKNCDVVITNPPFSLWREYADLLFEFNKKFLIIGNMNAITYSNVFPQIKNGNMWFGKTLQIKQFVNPQNEAAKFGNMYWFTNIKEFERKPLVLTCKYSPEKYPKYDNYDAINVDRVAEIPYDYEGVMGVPITFLEYWSPTKANIVGFRYGADGNDLHTHTHTIPYYRILCEFTEEKSKKKTVPEIVAHLHGPYMRGGGDVQQNNYKLVDGLNRHSTLYGTLNEGEYLTMVNGKLKFYKILCVLVTYNELNKDLYHGNLSKDKGIPTVGGGYKFARVVIKTQRRLNGE